MAQWVAAGLRGLRRASQDFPRLSRDLAGGSRSISTGRKKWWQVDVEPNVRMGNKPYGLEWGQKVKLGKDGLPLAVNWMNVKGALTDVRCQGKCGSCYICASMTSLESAFFLKTKMSVRLSTQHILDCNTLGNYGCGGGFAKGVLNFGVTNGGVLLEKHYPCSKFGKREQCTHMEEEGITLTGWRRVKANEQSLKYAVAYQPVIVSLKCDDSFRNYMAVNTLDILYSGHTMRSELNHQAVVVGYDVTPWGAEYWILLNSWAKGWGYLGFGFFGKNSPKVGKEGVLGMYLDMIVPVKLDKKELVTVMSRCQSCPTCFLKP